MCGQQKPEHPNWSSVADNAILLGGIGDLGSSFYICGSNTSSVMRHSSGKSWGIYEPPSREMLIFERKFCFLCVYKAHEKLWEISFA